MKLTRQNYTNHIRIIGATLCFALSLLCMPTLAQNFGDTREANYVVVQKKQSFFTPNHDVIDIYASERHVVAQVDRSLAWEKDK